MKIHQRSLPETRKRLKINWRLFFASLVTVSTVGTAIYFAHRAQMGGVTRAMLQRIEAQKESKDWKQAANSIERYLLIENGDRVRQVELAEVLDKSLPDELGANNFRILNRLIISQARALGVCEVDETLSERAPEIRRRMIERLMQAGRYEDSMDQIAKYAGPAIDGFSMKWLALSKYSMALDNRNHNFTDTTQIAIPEWLYSASSLSVVDLLLKSIIDNPGDIEISTAIAESCLGDPKFLEKSQLENLSPQELRDRAISVMDKMLASNREDLAAWMAHFSIASRLDPVRAESDIRQALSMAPENPAVLREAGSHFMNRALGSRGNELPKKDEWLELAQKYLSQAIEKGAKRDAKVYLGLGEVEWANGNFEKAFEVWENGARASVAPTSPLWFRLAQAWGSKRDLGKMKEVLESMDESIRNESTLITKRGQTSLLRVASQQWATYYALQGDYVRASKYLEDVIANDKEMDSENRSEVIASLGLCYLRSRQFDRAVEAYQDASNLTPSVDDRHRGYAEALAGANRLREAIDRMETIREKTAQDYLRICEMIQDYQSRNVREDSLWARFDEAFKEAAALGPTDVYLIERPWLLEVVQLDSSLNRISVESRTEALETVRKRYNELAQQYPNSLELQRIVISKLEGLGFTEDSRTLFSKIEESRPQDTSVLLSRVDYLLRDGMKDQAVELLTSRLAKDPSNPDLQSAAMRLNIATQVGDSQIQIDESISNNIAALIEAGRILLESRIFVGEMTDQTQIKEATERWCNNIELIEKKLRDAEGIEGTEWRHLRARRLLVKNEIDEATDLEEVEVLTNYLIQRRPSWASTYVLSGMLEDLKGTPTNAIKDFNRAIRLGDQNIRTYERLAELMFAQGQTADLKSLIERLGSKVNGSQRLSSIALGVTGDNPQELLERAYSGTEVRSKDPMAWVWLSQVLELSSRGKNPEVRKTDLLKAEEAINKARELSDNKSLAVYNAAFSLFFTTKQSEKLDGLLSDLAKSPIETTLKNLTLADYYQALDRMELAQNALLEARKSAKDPNAVDQRIAGLLIAQGKQDEAINLYRTLSANLPEDGNVRRSLVTLLASRGADADWEAIDLIYKNDKVAENEDDRRLRAELLARKGQQKDLALAQYLLESLVEDPKTRTDQDRFRLASIYLRNAALAEIQDEESPQVKQLLNSADKQLAALCRNAQAPVEYLYTYGDFLIKQDRIVEASDMADRLNGQDPDHFATNLLRARLQKINGNFDRAITIMVAWKDKAILNLPASSEISAKASILASAGNAINELGDAKQAEKILREAFELDPRRGTDYVRTLARSEDKTSRELAIRYLLEKLKEEQSPQVASLLAGILSVGDVSKDLAEQGEEILSEVGSANGNDAQLLLSIADMWLAQKKSSKAIDAYRKIVKLRPNDVVALNNLAILLGEEPDGTNEAISLIDQAMRIAGKQPLLLDSKAAILMLANRMDEAIPILEIAASATNDPRVAFHLYLALRKAGRDEEANRVKSRISPVELRKSILTPDDQAELEKFEKENPS